LITTVVCSHRTLPVNVCLEAAEEMELAQLRDLGRLPAAITELG